MTNEQKITFSTLNSLADKWNLYWKIIMEFDWMNDSMVSVDKDIMNFHNRDYLRKFKMTKNHISRISPTEVRLSNCCYVIIFNF